MLHYVGSLTGNLVCTFVALRLVEVISQLCNTMILIATPPAQFFFVKPVMSFLAS